MAARQSGCRAHGHGVLLNRQTRQAMCTVFQNCQKEKSSKELIVPLDKVYERVSRYFEISKRTLRKVVQTNFEDSTPGREKKRAKTVTGDGVDTFTTEAIRRILYNAYNRGEVLTLSTILQEASSSEIGYSGSVESLRTILRELGFRYKVNDNRRGLCENEEIVKKKIVFLRSYLENLNSENPMPFVFLDETWIFQHGSQVRSWIDDSGQTCKHLKSSEGRRFIVLHAGNRLGFIPGCDLLFASKSNSGDYHQEMNGTNFYKWVDEKLIPGLKERSIIIIDNAPYHGNLVEKQPTSSWKKADMISWLEKHSIEHDPSLTRPKLLDICRQNKQPPRYVIDELLLKHGHVVLRLPPYHCEYNAIEMVWGQCKQYYNKHIGFQKRFSIEMTTETWIEALKQVDASTWSRHIDHVEHLIKTDWVMMMGTEEMPRVEPMIISLDSEDDGSDASDSCSSFTSTSSSVCSSSSSASCCSNRSFASPLAHQLPSPILEVPAQGSLSYYMTTPSPIASCSEKIGASETSSSPFTSHSPCTSPSPAYSPISVIVTGQSGSSRKRKNMNQEIEVQSSLSSPISVIVTTQQTVKQPRLEKANAWSGLISNIPVIVTGSDPVFEASDYSTNSTRLVCVARKSVQQPRQVSQIGCTDITPVLLPTGLVRASVGGQLHSWPSSPLTCIALPPVVPPSELIIAARGVPQQPWQANMPSHAAPQPVGFQNGQIHTAGGVPTPSWPPPATCLALPPVVLPPELISVARGVPPPQHWQANLTSHSALPPGRLARSQIQAATGGMQHLPQPCHTPRCPPVPHVVLPPGLIQAARGVQPQPSITLLPHHHEFLPPVVFPQSFLDAAKGVNLVHSGQHRPRLTALPSPPSILNCAQGGVKRRLLLQ